MNLRRDFVTNSSSSSFIFKNNTDETLSSEEFMRRIFAKVIEDSKDRFELGPGESTLIECSDEGDDVFELFVHLVFDGWGSNSWARKDPGVEIQFYESHH